MTRPDFFFLPYLFLILVSVSFLAAAANSKSKLKGKPQFRSIAMTSLYICSVLWFSIHRTKSVFYSKNLRTILKSYGADEYTGKCILVMCVLCCVRLCTLTDILLSTFLKPILDSPKYIIRWGPGPHSIMTHLDRDVNEPFCLEKQNIPVQTRRL